MDEAGPGLHLQEVDVLGLDPGFDRPAPAGPWALEGRASTSRQNTQAYDGRQHMLFASQVAPTRQRREVADSVSCSPPAL